MYQSGGEISRIEDSLHRLGKKYGAKHVSELEKMIRNFRSNTKRRFQSEE